MGKTARELLDERNARTGATKPQRLVFDLPSGIKLVAQIKINNVVWIAKLLSNIDEKMGELVESDPSYEDNLLLQQVSQFGIIMSLICVEPRLTFEEAMEFMEDPEDVRYLADKIQSDIDIKRSLIGKASEDMESPEISHAPKEESEGNLRTPPGKILDAQLRAYNKMPPV